MNVLTLVIYDAQTYGIETVAAFNEYLLQKRRILARLPHLEHSHNTLGALIALLMRG